MSVSLRDNTTLDSRPCANASRAALTEAENKRSALAAGDDDASQQAIRALEAAIGARSPQLRPATTRFVVDIGEQA